MRKLISTMMTLMLVAAIGCQNEPTAGDKIRDVGDAIGDAAQDVGDGVKDAANDIKGDIDDKMTE